MFKISQRHNKKHDKNNYFKPNSFIFFTVTISLFIKKRNKNTKETLVSCYISTLESTCLVHWLFVLFKQSPGIFCLNVPFHSYLTEIIAKPTFSYSHFPFVIVITQFWNFSYNRYCVCINASIYSLAHLATFTLFGGQCRQLFCIGAN